MESATSALRWLVLDNPLSQTATRVAAHCIGQRTPLPVVPPPPPPAAIGGYLVRIAGLSGAAAVALGAYGAHRLRGAKNANPDLVQVFDTAQRYHLLHSAALLAVPLSRRPAAAGLLLAAGTLLFCGPCYYYALTADDKVRRVTPYGGMLLIAGWLALAL